MTDSRFSGVICAMAGSYQEAATPNEEATLLLIMLNPEQMRPVISHMSHWATKYGCPFNKSGIQAVVRHHSCCNPRLCFFSNLSAVTLFTKV